MEDQPSVNINTEPITYWLFQYNPAILDLKAVLQTELSSLFPIKAHSDKIKLGDKVILWQSGKQAACFGLATVSEMPEEQELLHQSQSAKWSDWPFFVALSLDYNLWKHPIEKNSLPLEHQKSGIFSGLPGSTFRANASDYQLLTGILKQTELQESPIIDYDLPKVPDYPLNLVLYGPPGTGKTYHTVNYALAAIEKSSLDELAAETRPQIRQRFNAYQANGQLAQVTFHSSMAYEDFVEGIKPNVKQNQLSYEVADGIFKQMCNKAKAHLADGLRFVLIIDELNRGNIPNIFGELITLIEADKRLGESEATQITLPYSKESFTVPNNLYIICTMNTADRSTSVIDAALRRRFAFIKMRPQASLLDPISKQPSLQPINLNLMLRSMNEKIGLLLDEDHCLGHAYFMNVRNLEDLKTVFYESIIPQLEDYFFRDSKKMSFILGDAFLDPNPIHKDMEWMKQWGEGHNYFTEEHFYQLKSPDEIDHTAFVNIYNSMKSKP